MTLATVALDHVPSNAFEQAVSHTGEVPGWRRISSGKVRELFIPDSAPSLGQADKVLVVATDRISAYDYILDTPIPGKGIVLTQLSLWWFAQLAQIVENHVLDEEVPREVAGRAMVCKRLEMYPVECVARGYLTGSGLGEYRAGGGPEGSGEVCGVALPPGLTEASRLPQPIYTPAIKAEVGEHDENVSNEVVAAKHGALIASRLEELTLRVYGRAAEIAAERGIILADTKFEFGALPGAYGRDEAAGFILGDEVLTPDSSRFWPADAWVEGQVTPSYDKQYVRDWLTSEASGWNRASGVQPPALPPEVIERTGQRYREAYRLLTGQKL